VLATFQKPVAGGKIEAGTFGLGPVAGKATFLEHGTNIIIELALRSDLK
jgi:hypothetical protein